MEQELEAAYLDDRFGDKIPSALAAKPELETYLLPVWRAFWFLCSDRSTGFGIGAIPTSSIFSYLDELGITEQEDRLWYFQLIRALDLEFLKLHNERQQSRPPKKKA